MMPIKAFYITLLSVAASLFGMLTNFALFGKFGTSSILDDYYWVLGFSLFISGVICASQSYLIIPALAAVKNIAIDFNKKFESYSNSAFFIGSAVFFVCSLSTYLLKGSYSTDFDVHLLIFIWLAAGVQILANPYICGLNAVGLQVKAATLVLLPPIFSSLGALFVTLDTLVAIPILQAVGFLIIVFYSAKLLKIKVQKIFSNRSFSLLTVETFKLQLIGLVATSCFTAYSFIDSLLLMESAEGVLTTVAFTQRLLIGLGNLFVAAASVLMVPRIVEFRSSGNRLKFVAQLFSWLFILWVGMGIFYALLKSNLIYGLMVSIWTQDAQIFLLFETINSYFPGTAFMLTGVLLFRAIFVFDNGKIIGAFAGLLWVGCYWALGLEYVEDGPGGLAYAYLISWLIVTGFVSVSLAILVSKMEVLKDV